MVALPAFYSFKKISLFYALREKCPGLYSVRMRENTDENNSEYGHFLRSDGFRATSSNFFDRAACIMLKDIMSEKGYSLSGKN